MTSIATHHDTSHAYVEKLWNKTMTSIATHHDTDHVHVRELWDEVWNAEIDTSTQADSNTYYPITGWTLEESPDFNTSTYLWHMNETLLKEELGGILVPHPVLLDVKRFVIAQLCTYLRPLLDKQLTDADFNEDPLLAKLDELANLPFGWEYGEGRPTLPFLSEVAREIYQTLAPFEFEADAFPAADGSLHLVFYSGSRSVELRLEADRTIDLSLEEKIGRYFEEIRSQDNISKREAINQVFYFLHRELLQWESSDSFIHGITITAKVNLTAPALSIPPTIPEYRW